MPPPDPDASRGATTAVWAAVPERILLAGVLVLAAIVYLPTLTFDLVYDDHWTIAANGFLRQADLSMLASPQAAARHIPDAFRPTLVTLDVWTYHWFGLNAGLHHALSVLLHVGVCWLLYAWLKALRAPLSLRITSVGIFGVLALHAEPVAVVSYREDLLAAAFGLLALCCAERCADATGRRRAAAALAAALCMALACGAKMSAAPLVAVFLLGRWLSPWRPRALRPAITAAAALGVGIAASVGQRVAVYGSFSPFDGADPRMMLPTEGLAATLAAGVQNQVEMLRQLVLPLGLSPEYVDTPARWSDAATLLCAAGLVVALGWALACATRWRRPVVALSILGTALLLGPTSGVAAMPNLRADRFMYLPSALACVGLAAGLLQLGQWLSDRTRGTPVRVQLAPVILFCVVQGGFAQAAANVYRSDTRLWTIALRRAPHSPRAHAVMGELLLRRAGAQEEPDPVLLARASAHCTIARIRDDGTALPLLCDARLAVLRKDWERAHRQFSKALTRSVHGRERVLASLASVTLDLPGVAWPERIAQSEAILARLAREYPYSAEGFATGGRISHRLGRPQLAQERYRRASALYPERWDLVIAGLELQVDLGHASAARLTWALYEDGIVHAVDLSNRKALRRRLHDAERLFGAPSP